MVPLQIGSCVLGGGDTGRAPAEASDSFSKFDARAIPGFEAPVPTQRKETRGVAQRKIRNKPLVVKGTLASDVCGNREGAGAEHELGF
mmetsp:Transcript_101003/g.292167  ORF Transcript_101003/g.292167 Transcript_101003/m.292167 type:complete len:88 (+) Transcript_101003:3-266(+)